MAKDLVNSPEELVEIVDEFDNVLEVVPRSSVYERPEAIHRVIRVLVYDKERKILFQKRSKNKKVLPGVWTMSVVGHVPAGVTPEEAAKNELMEELGLNLALEFVEKNISIVNDRRVMASIFTGEYKAGEMNLNLLEVQDAQFLDREQIQELIESGESFVLIALAEAEKFWTGKAK